MSFYGRSSPVCEVALPSLLYSPGRRDVCSTRLSVRCTLTDRASSNAQNGFCQPPETASMSDVAFKCRRLAVSDCTCTHESNQVISRSYSPGTKYWLRGESGYMYMYTPLPARPAARACEAGILALQSIPSSSVGRGARGMLMVERGITQGCCRPVGRICGWRPSCPQSLQSQVGGLEQRRAIRDQHSFRAGQIKTRFSE